METNNQLDNNPQEPQLEPKQNWFSKHMILGYLFVFMVLAATVSSIYYWQVVNQIPPIAALPVHHAQINQAANWQTYKDTTNGFSIEHPSSGYTIKPSPTASNLINIYGVDASGIPTLLPFISIEYLGPETASNQPENIFKQQVTKTINLGGSDVTTTTMTVAGFPAQAAVFTGPINSALYVFAAPDQVYEISVNYDYSGDISVNPAIQLLANQMLATFNTIPLSPISTPTPTPARSTSSPTSQDTSTWQTYKDNANGFSILYPPQYKVIPNNLKIDIYAANMTTNPTAKPLISIAYEPGTPASQWLPIAFTSQLSFTQLALSLITQPSSIFVISTGTATIGGIYRAQTIIMTGGANDSTQYFFIGEGRLYLVTAFYDSRSSVPSVASNKAMADSILATFKATTP